MDAKYAAALKAFPPFAQTAEALLPTTETKHAQLSVQVTAPVLFAYVWFILQEAERMGLKRIYFLARDGYIMLKIAQEIAKVCPVKPELRYLYCSRASLRMPCYHRIPESEMMDLLLHRGTNLTISHMLDRAHLTDAQRHTLLTQLCKDAGAVFAPESLHAPLSENDFAAVCSVLRNSTLFRDMVLENSRAAYAEAMPYFVQEGLTDGTPFAIADTGWTGSMQRNLRQLSEKIPPMTGFYFGMFAHPKSKEDGEYKTWYFSADSSIGVRTKFNNNLFECLCAAPHGMTIGYQKNRENRYAPIFKTSHADTIMRTAIETQISICTQFAQHCAPHIRYGEFSHDTMHRITQKLLQGLMYRPTAEEAEAFGAFPFCDDVTESYSDTLVRHNCRPVLRQHMPLTRILRKLRGKKPETELFWIYGTLAVSGLPLQVLRRPALRFWDILRCILDKRKSL